MKTRIVRYEKFDEYGRPTIAWYEIERHGWFGWRAYKKFETYQGYGWYLTVTFKTFDDARRVEQLMRENKPLNTTIRTPV